MRLFFLVFFLSGVASFSAAAADGAGNYAVWGKGKQSCFSYNQARDSDDTRDYKNYTMGYLTAVNVMMENTYSISGKMPLDEILEWVGDYCENHPLSSYDNALTEFSLNHFEMRSTSSSGVSW